MFEFNIYDKKYEQIHFIGIGGISMSSLAEILLSKGYNVTGTDSKDSAIVSRLEKLGAKIYIGHNKTNIQGADLIIYTDAISADNEELVAAFNSNVTVTDRATFLGAIMKNYKHSIAISGTHGKTSTTSMLASITNHGTLDPTVLLGGQLDEIGGNVRLGSDDYIVTEACEYKANILKYYPTMAIISNIDEDHLDYFRDLDHILDTFIGYAENLKEDNILVLNVDDENCMKLKTHTKAKVITFGVNKYADYKAENIYFGQDGSTTYLLTINGKEIWPIKLKVTGLHNVYNSLAAIVAAHNHGVSMELISKFISSYTGVHRRLELKGYIEGIKIVDDYAHHPTEIEVTLKALRDSNKANIYCVFQPHTFTRTKILLDKFATAFQDADKVVIADIFAAREPDNGEIHSKDLANAISKAGSDVIYLPTFEEIQQYLLKIARPDDVIVTMGAGNVYLIGESILEGSKEKAAVWHQLTIDNSQCTILRNKK